MYHEPNTVLMHVYIYDMLMHVHIYYISPYIYDGSYMSHVSHVLHISLHLRRILHPRRILSGLGFAQVCAYKHMYHTNLLFFRGNRVYQHL